MRIPCVALALASLTAIASAGCSGRGTPPKFEALPVRVVCTTTIVADLVSQVGGDRVAVQALMGPGKDPHTYISGAGDRRKLDEAHLVFFSGLHLEGKMADLFEKNKQRWRAHAVTDGIDRARLLHAEVDGGEHDPHVWFNVPLWSGTIDTVAHALGAVDPEGRAHYERNAASYREELARLDAEIRQTLGRVPKERRILVTSHDAFRYFGQEYGFQVVGLQGVSTAGELGTPQRDRLAHLIGQQKIPAVFTETSVPTDGLRAVLDDVHVKFQHAVKLIGGDDALYSDALGAPGAPGGTYSGMIRHNAKVIAEALAK